MYDVKGQTTGNPNTLIISNKNKGTVICLCSCVFFEPPFRRDLMTLSLLFKSQVTWLMHGHYEIWESLSRWELMVNNVIRNLRCNRRVIITMLQNRDNICYVNRWELVVNDITQNLNRLHFIQNPSKWLKKDTGTQVNKTTFIFVTDKVFGLPVVKPKRVRLFQVKIKNMAFFF